MGLNLPLGSHSQEGTDLHFQTTGLLCMNNFFHTSDIAFSLWLSPLFLFLGLGTCSHLLSLPPMLSSPWHLLEVAFPWWDSGAAGSAGIKENTLATSWPLTHSSSPLSKAR